ncbi:PAS domain-containing protein [Thiomicrorhabdus aquaedulcis]|uniref:PAS domain-containing protein n=1 Tax=Thiomicrorhabdus aquaedulcis TaxID=2211106 RepID=UPI000FDB5935|nr:PAS domain-containing protein [Thiomicrorhabdus aquaedulcis]
MRDNGHVTQKAYIIPPGSTIVSRTDLRGSIVAANESFIEASGYEWRELVGQPHNILRHPDVPEAVFKDFWQTLESGKPWSQVVKNRRKNGDHYWVVANATPIFENGAMAGFMSTRVAATAQQIAQAEKVYVAISQGKLSLKNGEIAQATNRFNLFNNVDLNIIISISALLILASAVLPSLFPSVFNIIPSLVIDAIDVGLVTLILVSLYKHNQHLSLLSSHITNISEGKFNNNINAVGNTLTAKIMGRLKCMQIKLGADLDDVTAALNNAKRIQSALDAASSSVMVIDRFRSIIFVNHSLQTLFTRITPQLQSAVPSFNPESIVRQNIELFNLPNQAFDF